MRLRLLLLHLLKSDEALLLALHRLGRPRVLNGLMRGVSHLGDGASWAALCGGLFVAGKKWRRHGRRLGVATGLATLTTQVLKRVLSRPRPSERFGEDALF